MQISEMTFENVTPVIEQIVKDAGEDFVFPGMCRYFNDFGEPQCLVGHVFHRMGVKYPDRAGNFDSVTNYFAVDNLFEVLGGEQRLGDALKMAQKAQDNREPWGEALSRYKQYREEVSTKTE